MIPWGLTLERMLGSGLEGGFECKGEVPVAGDRSLGFGRRDVLVTAVSWEDP